MKKKLLLLLLISLTACFSESSLNLEEFNQDVINQVMSEENINKKLDLYLNKWAESKRFSGSVLVSKDNQILLSKGYGMANIENDIVNISNTRFKIGSITKQFTAVSIMILQEQDLLNVNDTVDKYFPDSKNGSKITIHNLLCHSSGLRREMNNPEDYSDTENIIRNFNEANLEYIPGSKFLYSNFAYAVLGIIIEKTSGLSYENFLNENIFKPLKMNNSRYDNGNYYIDTDAVGYNCDEMGRFYIVEYLPAYSAGGIISTVEDLHIWNTALFSEKLINKDSLDLVLSPYILEYENNYYGYGFSINTQENTVSHNGSVPGFLSYSILFRDDNVSVIILSNFDKNISEELYLYISLSLEGIIKHSM